MVNEILCPTSHAERTEESVLNNFKFFLLSKKFAIPDSGEKFILKNISTENVINWLLEIPPPQ